MPPAIRTRRQGGQRPGRAAARHLLWLQNQLDGRFVAGLVLPKGRHVYELGERIVAAPTNTL